VTKADIAEAVYERMPTSRKDAAALVENVFDAMVAALQTEERMQIQGFGAFTVRAKALRAGRNPKTGAPLPIAPRRVTTFKPSGALRDLLNP